MRIFPRKLIHIVACGVFLMVARPLVLFASDVNELQSTLRDKLQRVEDLKKRAAIYETNLREKRQESLTLANQITILTDQISKTGLDIEAAKTSIEVTNLEIRNLEDNIKAKEKQITDYKIQLASLVRWQDREQNRSILQVLFTRSSFSDFYGAIRQIESIQARIGGIVKDVESLKDTLTRDKSLLEEKIAKLNNELADLNDQQLAIEAQQETKAYLLRETKSSEKRFASLLDAAKMEQEQTSQEITDLEKEVRKKLASEGVNTGGDKPALIWPVVHDRGLATIFHDPDYPFRRLFEHSGIDIRAYQGTAIRAAASGYIARVQTGGKKGYGFIMIVHNGGLATVYGHVSKAMVQQDSFVAQGQIIALSGGIPGTPGAGPFSTGPHLHFETRLNGIPVDPMQFLP